MFRELRRIKNKISIEEAKELLHKEKRGVFAVNGDNGYPFAIPVDYFFDEQDNKIIFHGAKSGHKVDSLKKDNKVCFTIFGDESFNEGDWAPYLKSVVVFGRCNMIEDIDITTDKIRTLASRFYPSSEEVELEIQKYIKDALLYEIDIEHICGKKIHEK